MTSGMETGSTTTGLGEMREEAARNLSGAEGVAQLASAAALPDLEDQGFPGPIAEALFYDDSTLAFIQGPVGSGKTTTTLKSRLRRAMAMPRSVKDNKRHYKLTIVRETYRQLWSTTIPDFLGVYPKHMGDWAGGRGGPVTFVMPFEDAHGEIIFTAEFMAFGDAIEESMRGIKTTDLWLHEADTNPKKVLVNGITRIDRYPDKDHFDGYRMDQRSYGQVVGDLNAPEEDNWFAPILTDPAGRERLIREIAETMPEGAPAFNIAVHRQPGFGEPGAENLANLGPGYYEKQIATQRLLGQSDATERLVYNRVSFRKLGDPVFEREFDPRIHVAAETLPLIRDLPLRIGFDQGFKGAAVIGQFKPPYHWRIYAVLFFPAERLMAHTFGERLADLLDTPRFAHHEVEAGWGDMAGEHGASQGADENATWNKLVSRASGVKIRPQRVGTNRITPRLEGVRAPLEYLNAGEPGLLICPTCRPLIAGFTARYVWTDEIDKNGDKRKVPDKSIAEANVMDALQYLLLSEHLGNGLSPVEATRQSADRRRNPDRQPPAEQTTAYDVLEPYA